MRRVKRTKDSARRAYDRLSKVYDLLAGSSETPLMQLGLEMLAVGEGEVVLEVGAGTGKALEELCKCVGKNGGVYGLDLSAGMLSIAHSRVFQEDGHKRASLLEGDGAFIPFKQGSFTAVFLSFTLELFDTPEIPQVLGECHRVLQPGGRLGVVSLHRGEVAGLPVRLYEWFHDQFPAWADCRPIWAADMIGNSGFSIEKRRIQRMWGLPVELLLAAKH